MTSFGEKIGYVISGSLKEGFLARLTVPANTVQEGAFVVIESGLNKFYGLITNMRLGAVDPRYAEDRLTPSFPKDVAALLQKKTLYTELEIMPQLMVEQQPDPGTPEFEDFFKDNKPHGPMPVKTLPAHQAPVNVASAFDVAQIFGQPDNMTKFAIGTTREQGHPVAIDLEKLVQRSSGIFGATGTGKSYLTRLILAGLIHSNTASVLVFDMHNEYAFGDRSPDTGVMVPGLKDRLGNKVKVCALGRGTAIRKQKTDFDLVLEKREIMPEDVEMLSRELNLKETTSTTLSALVRSFGVQNWFAAFMNMNTGDGEGSVKEWAENPNNNVNVMAAMGLHNKLSRVFEKEYIVDRAPQNAVNQIIEFLKNGDSVIFSFGKYSSDLDYLLVTNILTRKVREAWEKMTNDTFSDGKGKPPSLVIAVEEAHKLLNREMAAQTAFSVIAREMRKYYVTLLIIDQRPSQIYDEVMSQLGTRISGWLGDDADISAVLSGLANRESLRGMLARLQPKEEILLLGWGVPMPLPVRTTRYDEGFWKTLLSADAKNRITIPFVKGEDDFLTNG